MTATASKQALEGSVVVAQSESDCDSLPCYGDDARKEVEELRQEISRLNAQVGKLLRVEFCLGRFRHYVKGFHYYTGLPDFATFRMTFKWLPNPHAEMICQYDTQRCKGEGEVVFSQANAHARKGVFLVFYVF